MGFFSTFFTKVQGKNSTSKLSSTKLKNASTDNIENPFKSFSKNIFQFFRTSRVVNAYQNENHKRITFLLQKGKKYYKSVKFPENHNFSLLHQAITDKNINVIEIILSNKYSHDKDIIEDKDNKLGLAPLHLACMYNSVEILDLLLKKSNSDINTLTAEEDLNVLHISASSGSLICLSYLYENYYKNIKNLERKKCSLDVYNNEKWTPLHYACFLNKIDITNFLLEKGSNILNQNNQRLTPLALCVLSDNYDLFYALYNFHFKDPYSNISSDKEYEMDVSEEAKLIHLAASSKNGTKCLDYLLSDPNNVNLICSKELNATPLHFACMKNNVKAVRSILRYNANANISDYLGNTPLFYATENGNLEILKLLHENGADGTKKNNNGINCYQIAMNQENREVKLFYLSQNQYRLLSEKDRVF